MVRAHRNAKEACLTCFEHGPPYDGPCEHCGYTHRRFLPSDMERFDRYQAAKEATDGE